MCGFHKFKLQVWMFSYKCLAYLQDTFFPFCQETSGGLFLNIHLIFNFIRFVIQVKENLYAYTLARLIDENKYIYRFHASFSVLRAVSTTIHLTKNSCCEIFSIIFEILVMPFSPDFYAKQKNSFWEIIQFVLYLLSKNIRNAFLGFLEKLKSRFFSLAPTMVAPTRKTYMNFWLFKLLQVCRRPWYDWCTYGQLF